MPSGSKSREDLVRDSVYAPIRIDTSIEFNIPRSNVMFDPKKHKFRCSCCGKPFSVQKGNFHKTNGVLFQSNDGYLPWCIECEDKYISLLTALYSNNEEHAIKHYCEQVDWVYEINPLIASSEYEAGHRDRTRLSHYSARKNINVGGRKTFIDSLKNEYKNKLGDIVKSKEEVKEKELSITAVSVDRWGAGLTEWDYQILEDHYKMLKKNNPNCDNNAEIFIKSLCNLHWLQAKMLRSDNVDATKYTSLVEQYSKTFIRAGLKTVEEKDSSNDETVGVTLATISRYTPEEFYKDKNLYEDWDGIGDYYDRHVCRPMQNLMTGTDIRDKEYFVPDDGDEYEE